LPIRFDLKFKTEEAGADKKEKTVDSDEKKIENQEEKKKPEEIKQELRSEVYKPDELDDEEFVWKE